MKIKEKMGYSILILTIIGFSGMFAHMQLAQSYSERPYHKIQIILDRLEVTDQLEKINVNEWYRLFLKVEYLRINGYYGRSFASYDPHYTDWDGLYYFYTWGIPADALFTQEDDFVIEWSYCCEFGGSYGDIDGDQISIVFQLQRMRYNNWVMETGEIAKSYGDGEEYSTSFSTGTLNYACFGGELEIDFVVNRL